MLSHADMLERYATHPEPKSAAPHGSERKHLSDVDVARAGGWRTIQVMKQSYQLADAAAVLKVVENAPAGHTLDTVITEVPGTATT